MSLESVSASLAQYPTLATHYPKYVEIIKTKFPELVPTNLCRNAADKALLKRPKFNEYCIIYLSHLAGSAYARFFKTNSQNPDEIEDSYFKAITFDIEGDKELSFLIEAVL